MKKLPVLLLAALLCLWSCDTTNPRPNIPPVDHSGTNDKPGDDNPGGGDQPGDQPGSDEPLPLITVYAETFDGDPSYTGWVTSGNWHQTSGDGSTVVRYTSRNANIRNDNFGSAGGNGGYEGASGKGYVRITHNNNEFGYVTVSNINACGRTKFRLLFGAAQGPNVLKVEYSLNSTAWTNVEYSFKPDYNVWGRAVGEFELPSGSGYFSLRFTLLGQYSEYRYGANIDDILLTSGGDDAGAEMYVSPNAGKINKYIECPAVDDDPDYFYSTLYTTTVNSGKHVRNYSFCYDIRRRNPIWVAFPMHAIYCEGSGRTTPDPWQAYPGLPLSQQSIIWDINGDNHQYWSYSAPQSKCLMYGRGHLCMSSSRSGAGKEINVQTFYPVNVAPQVAIDAFSSIWGATESLHWQRGTQLCSDTLYVVCGLYYDDDDWIEYDACYMDDRSTQSKACVIPTEQFKVFLRTRSGVTGRAVQNCKPEELKSIGFWIPTMPAANASANLADYAVSVAEIERRTGYRLFPGIPDEVKTQCDTREWL